MWQRFTERARRVVFFAQEEAKKLEQGYVEPEHLLLGMLREPDSVSSKVILASGIALERIHERVVSQLPVGNGTVIDMQLTPGAKRVIDLSYKEAKNLDNNFIGTEHLLLALLRMDDTIAGKALLEAGLTYDAVYSAIQKLQQQADVNPKDTLDSTPREGLQQMQEKLASVMTPEELKAFAEAIQQMREFAAKSGPGAIKDVPAIIREISQKVQERLASGQMGAVQQTSGGGAPPSNPPHIGDLGLLQSASGHSKVEVVLVEEALEEYLHVMEAHDSHGYEQLLASGKMLATPVSTEAKVLVPGHVKSRPVAGSVARNAPEKGVFHLIRLLSDPVVGQKGYVEVSNFAYVGPDTRPFPPE